MKRLLLGVSPTLVLLLGEVGVRLLRPQNLALSKTEIESAKARMIVMLLPTPSIPKIRERARVEI